MAFQAPKLITVESFTVSGVSVRTKSSEEFDKSMARLPKLWQEFLAIVNKKPNLLANPEVYGVYSDYDSDANGNYTVTIGGVLDAGQSLPEFSFMFNLGIAKIENSKDVLKEGISHTAGDVAFIILLKYGARSAAGPVGWGTVGLDIADTLVYDEKFIEKSFVGGVTDLNESQKLLHEGNLLGAYGMQQLAAAQVELAGCAE